MLRALVMIWTNWIIALSFLSMGFQSGWRVYHSRAGCPGCWSQMWWCFQFPSNWWSWWGWVLERSAIWRPQCNQVLWLNRYNCRSICQPCTLPYCGGSRMFNCPNSQIGLRKSQTRQSHLLRKEDRQQHESGLLLSSLKSHIQHSRPMLQPEACHM